MIIRILQGPHHEWIIVELEDAKKKASVAPAAAAAGGPPVHVVKPKLPAMTSKRQKRLQWQLHKRYPRRTNRGRDLVQEGDRLCVVWLQMCHRP